MDEIEVLPGVFASKDYALYLEEHGALVIADLHLGYEGALREQGVSLPRFQKRHILERLASLMDQYHPDVLVVDGDFKHEFSRNLTEEWNEVLDVLDFLERRTEVVMIRGNHDNFLKTILNRKGLDLHRSYEFGAFTIAHGHEPVEAKGALILGHEHPSMRLRDKIGASVSLPCFVITPEVTILPAFSPLAYGSDILRGPYLSPILDHRLMQGARLYGLDEKLGILDFGRTEDILRQS
ncbi:MAG: metallophosphoesterase [Thermoplasmata archaeon]